MQNWARKLQQTLRIPQENLPERPAVCSWIQETTIERRGLPHVHSSQGIQDHVATCEMSKPQPNNHGRLQALLIAKTTPEDPGKCGWTLQSYAHCGVRTYHSEPCSPWKIDLQHSRSSSRDDPLLCIMANRDVPRSA